METLCWGWNHMPKSIIFGKMIELALPIVKSYHSDFYHDVMWLEALPERSVTIYYTVRETGTWISTELYKPNDSDTIFRITVTDDGDGKWLYSAEKV